MKLTVENTRGKNVRIYDVMGNEISGVYSFDTKTCKISFYLVTPKTSRGTRKAVVALNSKGKARAKKITTTVRGAYAVVNGERVK